jgi:hypothetical protein
MQEKAEIIPEPVMEPVEKPVENPVPAPEPLTSIRRSPSFISIEPLAEEIPAPEPQIPEAPAPAISPEPEPAPMQAKIPEPVQQTGTPQKITFDLFSDVTASTLADRLKEGQEKRIADKLTENKGVDLRTSIGINDKFLFINELFDGNMRIYDDIVQKLNSAVTSAQVDLLLLDLKIAYNWDSESPTVKKFVELVRRKF